jgi:[acyl-carrier-protein] S-malonyltransferase
MPLDPTSTAYLFPGQGSQAVGMGKALASAEPAAAETFRLADELLGFRLSSLCWEGPESALNETINTQPALLVHSVAVLRVLQARFPGWEPACAAGHSMGEFSALVACGSLSFEDALRLVRLRGELMQEAGIMAPGGMMAVLGLPSDAVDGACRQASEQSGGTVQLANDNCPGQVVISGDKAGLAAAAEQLKAIGAKKIVRLAVSIAAHSPLMAPAQARFDRAIEAAEIKAPKIPIYGNVSARALRSAGEVRADLAAQLTSRVRWTESIQGMIQSGVTTFAELGSGSVLIGLVRRIDRSPTTYSLDAPESFAVFSE